MEKLSARFLMIDDWVYIKDYPIKFQPKKVRPEHFVRSLVEFEPIPITPQILEKNGFVKSVENEHGCTYRLLIPTGYKETPYSIQFAFYNEPISGVNTLFNCWGPTSSEGRGVNDIHMCNIESVHELQHILKLCKIDKEIEL